MGSMLTSTPALKWKKLCRICYRVICTILSTSDEGDFLPNMMHPRETKIYETFCLL